MDFSRGTKETLNEQLRQQDCWGLVKDFIYEYDKALFQNITYSSLQKDTKACLKNYNIYIFRQNRHIHFCNR